MTLAVYVGYDDREAVAFDVLKHSIKRRTSAHVDVIPLRHMELRKWGMFLREWETKADGQPVCKVDGRPFSTQFSHSRFLVPHLARRARCNWAIFVDCDFLFLDDVVKLVQSVPPAVAVSVCKHEFKPVNATKMDGVVQQGYQRKLWSSLMVFNVSHPALDVLSVDYVNRADGRELHGFTWLPDVYLGGIGLDWNWLPGVSHGVPKAVHYTEGMPWLPGRENEPYSAEWFREAVHMHHGSLFA